MPYIEREKGVRIHYNHYGQGFPLVFLHGFSANAWLWAYQAPVLAHKYHCIVIEARGHGLSSKPLTGYSIQDMAADDAAALAALGIDRAILVGNSMGGMRAMQMSLDYPHLVAGNVIISSATNLHQTLDTAELIASFQNDYEAAADDLVTRCFSTKTRTERPEVCQMIKNNFLNDSGFPRRVALACLEDPNGVWQWDISDRLQEITQPTLVLVGEEDQATPVAANRFLAERIPGAELRVIKDVGHCYEIERPLEFNQVLEEFVAQHGR